MYRGQGQSCILHTQLIQWV